MWVVVKQPSGKYCIFSSVVDNILHYDCKAADVIKIFVDAAKKESYRQISEALEELAEDEKLNKVMYPFDKMIETIESVHGKDQAEKVLKMLS